MLWSSSTLASAASSGGSACFSTCIHAHVCVQTCAHVYVSAHVHGHQSLITAPVWPGNSRRRRWRRPACPPRRRELAPCPRATAPTHTAHVMHTCMPILSADAAHTCMYCIHTYAHTYVRTSAHTYICIVGIRAEYTYSYIDRSIDPL